jgi:hypothetical protein
MTTIAPSVIPASSAISFQSTLTFVPMMNLRIKTRLFTILCLVYVLRRHPYKKQAKTFQGKGGTCSPIIVIDSVWMDLIISVEAKNT